jgi:hypothetical protein
MENFPDSTVVVQGRAGITIVLFLHAAYQPNLFGGKDFMLMTTVAPPSATAP